MMTIKRYGLSLLLMFNMLILPIIALPATAQAAVAEGCSTTLLTLPTWYKYLDVGPEDNNKNNGDPCAIIGPKDSSGNFDWQKAAGYVAIAVVEVLLRLGSLVAVGFVIYGGFRLITSQGDPEGAKNGRNTIINAVIGLVITIASASIVSFIATRLTS